MLQPWPIDVVKGIKRRFTSKSRGSRIYASSKRFKSCVPRTREMANGSFNEKLESSTMSVPSQSVLPVKNATPSLGVEDSFVSEAIDLTLDQSLADSTILTESMEQSLVDDEPSEASFSRHLEEDQPRTAVSTPAKPESDSAIFGRSVDNDEKCLKPKRQLPIDIATSPLVHQGK